MIRLTKRDILESILLGLVAALILGALLISVTGVWK